VVVTISTSGTRPRSSVTRPQGRRLVWSLPVVRVVFVVSRRGRTRTRKLKEERGREEGREGGRGGGVGIWARWESLFFLVSSSWFLFSSFFCVGIYSLFEGVRRGGERREGGREGGVRGGQMF